MKFQDIVKQLRLERGWSQQDVADRIGLTKMTVSQYENGKRKPSFEMIEVLADVFHVDLNFLLGFTKKIEKPAGDQTDPAANKYLAVTLTEIHLIEAFRERLLQTFVSDVTISPDDVVIAYNTTEKGPSQCSSTDRKVEIVGSYSNPVILEGRIVLRIQRT